MSTKVDSYVFKWDENTEKKFKRESVLFLNKNYNIDLMLKHCASSLNTSYLVLKTLWFNNKIIRNEVLNLVQMRVIRKPFATNKKKKSNIQESQELGKAHFRIQIQDAELKEAIIEKNKAIFQSQQTELALNKSLQRVEHLTKQYDLLLNDFNKLKISKVDPQYERQIAHLQSISKQLQNEYNAQNEKLRLLQESFKNLQSIKNITVIPLINQENSQKIDKYSPSFFKKDHEGNLEKVH
jgi:hypothetical protein